MSWSFAGETISDDKCYCSPSGKEISKSGTTGRTCSPAGGVVSCGSSVTGGGGTTSVLTAPSTAQSTVTYNIGGTILHVGDSYCDANRNIFKFNGTELVYMGSGCTQTSQTSQSSTQSYDCSWGSNPIQYAKAGQSACINGITRYCHDIGDGYYDWSWNQDVDNTCTGGSIDTSNTKTTTILPDNPSASSGTCPYGTYLDQTTAMEECRTSPVTPIQTQSIQEVKCRCDVEYDAFDPCFTKTCDPSLSTTSSVIPKTQTPANVVLTDLFVDPITITPGSTAKVTVQFVNNGGTDAGTTKFKVYAKEDPGWSTVITLTSLKAGYTWSTFVTYSSSSSLKPGTVTICVDPV